MGTPFVAITPDIEVKMQGLLDILDYPIKEIFNKSTLTAKEMFPTVLKVWQNRSEYRIHIEKKIPQIKQDASMVYSKIIEGIKHANIK
jgi:hypothetical protein